ncbi:MULTISPECIES: hypothetical protein [unclassified Crossiella]|uniref:hypothetical protein n=1 Tax=unclassified Crossiella TaxID=2620835 RepID=UPI001FFEE45B|nr:MULTISPECIES: hypothetical protein [unclassified Crossiella]MCK2240997.1 hypothetical protein [Crossiella sp. S99.2]MCK2253859.1 hypothetical protein [Crossiella sp. S99.1]
MQSTSGHLAKGRVIEQVLRLVPDLFAREQMGTSDADRLLRSNEHLVNALLAHPISIDRLAEQPAARRRLYRTRFVLTCLRWWELARVGIPVQRIAQRDAYKVSVVEERLCYAARYPTEVMQLDPISPRPTLALLAGRAASTAPPPSATPDYQDLSRILAALKR